MKMKMRLGSALILLLSVWLDTYAANYFPPERINCSLDNTLNLLCKGFNRQYLSEDSYSRNISNNNESFYFYSATAYFKPGTSDTFIYIVYKNSYAKKVKKVTLKSIRSSIKPSIDFGSWRKVEDNRYLCSAGYMNCPMSV